MSKEKHPEGIGARLEDSNIAGLGGADDKALREKAAATEEAYKGAGKAPGLEVWRIESFEVKRWKKVCFFLSLMLSRYV